MDRKVREGKGGREWRATCGLVGGGSGDVGGGVLPGVGSTLAAGSAPQAEPRKECVRAATWAGTRPALRAPDTLAHAHVLDCLL